MHKNKKIVLASESERRIQLLKDLKIPFEYEKSRFKELHFEETTMSPSEFAVHNAVEKARDIARKEKNAIVVGMDTIGTYKGRLLGKPRDRAHAKEMIELLNGKTHEVITGICITDSDTEMEVTGAETTLVTFTEMTENDIESYLDIGLWKGIACSYAIQGIGSLFIEKIEGDYFNVVGFPIFRFTHLMKEMGVHIVDLIGKRKKK